MVLLSFISILNLYELENGGNLVRASVIGKLKSPGTAN